ncbi:hypothetical protein GCM10027590_34550 [Nocardiopsis nanhaiensis]
MVTAAELRTGEVGHREAKRVAEHEGHQGRPVLEQPYLKFVVESGHGMKLLSVVA